MDFRFSFTRLWYLLIVMSYKGEGRYPDCLHLKNLPSLLSRPDLGWSCSSRFHIYIIKWKTRRLQYWLINKYTGINSYYYHSLPFWLRAKRFLTSVEKAFDLGRKGIRLKAKGLWPGCLTTETYPLSLNIESSEADLVSDEGKHKRWRQFADDGETP